MTTLWDTTGTAVVKALAAERRVSGAASGLVLTLVVVTDEAQVEATEQAATQAASQHPCRVLVVVRRQTSAPEPRLDAEVSIGGRLGPGETVVMRMYGRLGLHAESVVLPLLAPDAPVVTWWFGGPPDLIAHDPLGVLAGRRVTDVQNTDDPRAGLLARAHDYASGDTDLAWTRTTPWRSVLAGAYDAVTGRPTRAQVLAEPTSPSAALLAAWLGGRLNLDVSLEEHRGPGVARVELAVDGGQQAGGTDITLVRDSEHSGRLSRTDEPDRTMPLPRAEHGDLLAEELRRLEPDPVYAEALGRLTGLGDLADRSAVRSHIWRDPAEQAAAHA